MGSLVVFAITPLLRSLEIYALIISVFRGEKFKGGTSWHTVTSANYIVKPNLTIFKTNWSCVVFAHFSKQFVILPRLNFSTSALRVSIGMWRLTILLIRKPISARSFLICGCFGSSHVSHDCNGFFCWIVFLVLPMCLGSCTVTVGCPCGQSWVFWLAYQFLRFQLSLSWSMGRGFWFECL